MYEGLISAGLRDRLSAVWVVARRLPSKWGGVVAALQGREREMAALLATAHVHLPSTTQEELASPSSEGGQPLPT